MNKNLILLLVIAAGFLYSCGNAERKNTENKQDAILQKQDGTISLDVNKASTYQDSQNPESNTAEWNVVISKSGRFNIWLSSATTDTTKLEYKKPVLLSVKDDRIEARPAVDKIIHDQADVSYPFFRADSFIGSLYLPDTGVYNIQVISDRIIPNGNKVSPADDDTRLISVSLTPVTN